MIEKVYIHRIMNMPGGAQMTIRQISIEAEDRPGELARLTRILSDKHINIIALSINQLEAGKTGLIRIVVNNCDEAIRILDEEGYHLKVCELLPIRMVDVPGSLASVAEILSRNGINIVYGYTLITKPAERAVFLARVDDVKRAFDVLREAGIPLASERMHRQDLDDQSLAEIEDGPDDYMLAEIDDLVYFMRD
jgi:hypothetical protein